MDIQILVKAARTGDAEAFGKLYDILLDAVYRFVYFRVGDRHTAEDITEATFVSAFEHIQNYQERGLPFEAWIFRIARNKLTDHYRSHKTKVPLEAISEIPDTKETPEEYTDRRLNREAVLTCVRKLPETYQEIIILKYIDGMENEEIARLLDKPIPHVRVLQSRALAKLRGVMKYE